MLKLGEKTISKLYYGDKAISKAYLGDKLVYSGQSTFVDYLKFDGNSWIDTGVIGDIDTSYEIEMSTQASGFLMMILFGSRTSATSNVLATLVRQDTNQIVSDFGDYTKTRHSYTDLFESNKRYKIYNSKNERSVYNYSTGETETVSTAFSGSLKTPTNLYIGYKSSGFLAQHNNFEGNVYGCKIWQGDILVRDLKPCITSSGVVCMYDAVSKKYFYNAGTGEFLYG